MFEHQSRCGRVQSRVVAVHQPHRCGPMYVPKSDPDSIDDKDVMGVYIAPVEHYLGFGGKDVFEKWEGEWDCVFYELRKMFGLLLNCNPNVLSILWLKENGIIYESSL